MWESPSGGAAAAAGSTGALTGCPFARGSTAPVGALLPAAGAVAEGFEPLPPPARFAWCFDPVARDAPPPVVDVAVGIGLVVGVADPLDPSPTCPDDRLWRTGRATGRTGKASRLTATSAWPVTQTGVWSLEAEYV